MVGVIVEGDIVGEANEGNKVGYAVGTIVGAADVIPGAITGGDTTGDEDGNALVGVTTGCVEGDRDTGGRVGPLSTGLTGVRVGFWLGVLVGFTTGDFVGLRDGSTVGGRVTLGRGVCGALVGLCNGWVMRGQDVW